MSEVVLARTNQIKSWMPPTSRDGGKVLLMLDAMWSRFSGPLPLSFPPRPVLVVTEDKLTATHINAAICQGMQTQSHRHMAHMFHEVCSCIGDRILSNAASRWTCALFMWEPNPSPALDKDRAPLATKILSGAGVWRKALVSRIQLCTVYILSATTFLAYSVDDNVQLSPVLALQYDI